MKRKLGIAILALALAGLLAGTALAAAESGPQLKSGTLKLIVNGEAFTQRTLSAGVNDNLQLKVDSGNGYPVDLSPDDVEDLRVDGTVVTKVEIYGREVTEGNQTFTVSICKVTVAQPEDPTATGWIKYGDSQVTITCAPKQLKSGTLKLIVNGEAFIQHALSAGVNDNLQLRVDSGNGYPVDLSPDDVEDLRVDGTVVTKVEIYRREVTEDNRTFTVSICKVTVAQPEDPNTTGWIQYGNDESNRVTITCDTQQGSQQPEGPPEGQQPTQPEGPPQFLEVNYNDRVTALFNSKGEFCGYSVGETEYTISAAEFQWNDATYFLGVAQETQNDALHPYGIGSEGFTDHNNTARFGVRVFSRLSSGGFQAKEEEEVRQAILDPNSGFTLALTLRPTNIGCAKYPVQSKANGWTQLLFGDLGTAGYWVLEGTLKDPEGAVVARCAYTPQFVYMPDTRVDLTSKTTVAEINTAMADALSQYSSVDNRLCKPSTTFVLPARELTGELTIPNVPCTVTLEGAGYASGKKISTTLNGGICTAESNYMVLAYGIHFVGAGKNVETLDSRKPNSATYGASECVPHWCVVEGYWRALTSSGRPAAAANDCVFLNNGVAVYADGTAGANLMLTDNWFVNNGTAVQLERLPGASYTPTGNRFVNNGLDVVNNTGYSLWLPLNFFYHDSLLGQIIGTAQPWEPALWTEADGVLTLNINNNKITATNADGRSFDTSAGYNPIQFVANNILYKTHLPMLGGRTPTYLLKLARDQGCSYQSVFYPRWWIHVPGWWTGGNTYPTRVRSGETIGTDALDSGVCVYPENGGAFFDFAPRQ